MRIDFLQQKKKTSFGDSTESGCWLAIRVRSNPKLRTQFHFLSLGEWYSSSSNWTANHGWKRCNHSWLVFFHWCGSEWSVVSSRLKDRRVMAQKPPASTAHPGISLEYFWNEVCLLYMAVTSLQRPRSAVDCLEEWTCRRQGKSGHVTQLVIF